MKILHYALGFPPYRTGGLTKFCVDIMGQQLKLGYEVALLWPGQMMLVGNNVRIKRQKDNKGIKSFEIINPLPVSYDEGIKEIEVFTHGSNTAVYENFLYEYKPDVIHIHSLMGLHREFIEVAKQYSIKTVFSVHDFFPICPKVTLYRKGAICQSASDCSECPQCNLTALSLKKIYILQSPLYRYFKDNPFMKMLRKSHRDQYLSGKSGENVENIIKCSRNADDYKFIRKYYSNIITLIDIVHYNSSVTKSVFEKYISVKDSETISITHKDIVDKRRIKSFSNKLHLTYLGPQGGSKGFFLLKAALDELWKTNKSFVLNVYFTPTDMSPYIHAHESYKYSELEVIFNYTDVVIAPSVWYETFGFTVLEALSFGVPVVISDTVGSKDIIPEGCGIVIQDIDKDKLKEVIQTLSPEVLTILNRNIIERVEITSIEKMTYEILKRCY